MREVVPLTVSLALGVSSLFSTALVPRKSPELKFLDSSGKEIRLSSFKGKVVVIEFLLANCPHCQRVARTINKLHRELGRRGFQPIGVVFDNGIGGPAVANFVHYFKITFPVGYTSSDQVDIYLGRAGAERFQVPQMVVIDRAGVIRAQSPGRGDPNLEDENYLRNLINNLLKKGAPAPNTKTTFPPKKAS